jgi:flagellar hook-length control protein FliK
VGAAGAPPSDPALATAGLWHRQGITAATSQPGEALGAVLERTSSMPAPGDRPVDPQLSLAALRPSIEAPAGISQPHAPASPPVTHTNAPPPIAQIHLQITRAVTEHVDHIRVRLEPPELGHVEIKLHFGDDNRFTGVVTVDRSETLDLLQRDAAALERGLRDAGLRADGGGLSFTLRRDQQESTGGQPGGSGIRPDPADGPPAEAGPEAPASSGGLDLLRLLDIRA